MLNITSKPLNPKLISIILPVFNESASVAKVVQQLHSVKWPLDFEIVAVNDGSSDGSKEALDELAKAGKIRVFHHTKNKGKGATLRTGIEQVRGQITAIQDADFEYDPNDLATLVNPIIEGNADVVYGSRFKKSVRQVHRTFHMLVNRFLTLLSNMVSGIYLSDMETCYKVFRTDLLKAFNLKTNRFGFEVEVTAYVSKLPIRILEFPINYFPRNYSEGKKIGWKDGIAAIYHIFRFNLLVSPKECINPKTEMSEYLFPTNRKTC